MPSISGLNHITLAVNSIDIAFEFYTNTLGLKPEAKWNNGAYLSANGLWLCLSADDVQPSTDYSHIAFTINSDELTYWAKKLTEAGATLWKENSSEGESLYFLDPDGHRLELHAGDMNSRLASINANPYDGQTLY